MVRSASFDKRHASAALVGLALSAPGCGGAGADRDTGSPWGSGSGSSGSGDSGGASGAGTGDDGATTGAGTDGGAGSGDGDSPTTSAGSGESGDSGESGGSGESGDSGESGGSGGIRFDIGGGQDTAGPGEGGSGSNGCEYLDILFIVDISGSMTEEQANLEANFPDFVRVLDEFVGDPGRGVLGYRLGVTNSSFTADRSSMGLDGALYSDGNCAPGAWLDGPAAGISDSFSCLAEWPVGCGAVCSDYGRERPLDAMVAFGDRSGAGGTNDGFYRGDEALLVIVTLTDEDDQSNASPAETKAYLDEFTRGARRYVIVSIAGPANEGCSSAFGDAAATPRLSDFTNQVENGYFGDICQGDLAQPLADALDLIKYSCDELPPPVG